MCVSANHGFLCVSVCGGGGGGGGGGVRLTSRVGLFGEQLVRS